MLDGNQKRKSPAFSNIRPILIQFWYALVPLLVLLAAIVLSCLLAYCLMLVWGDDLSFRIVIKKATQIFLVLSIFPAMHYLKLNRFDLGFSRRPQFIMQIRQGFGLGFATLLPVFIVLYLLNVNVIDAAQPWTTAWVSKKLVIELLLALLISFLEEPLFRGLMITSLAQKMSANSAILISAFYYAALHFLDSKTQIPAQDLKLFSGFQLFAEALLHLLNPEILSAFIALFTVGVFLGLLRTHIKASLGLCIGCHAAWVWMIKLSKTFFNTNPNSDYLFLISSYDGVIGPLVTSWLAMAILGFAWYRRNKGGRL